MGGTTILLLESFRDLGKTLSPPMVTFESIDSIPPSDVHDAHSPSLASTTPSISIAAQKFSQHLSFYDVSLISNDSSIDNSTDLLSSSAAFSLPMVLMGVGLGILGLTRKEGEDPFDGLGLVHISRSSRDPSSDGEISHTTLREVAQTFLQPSMCLGIDDNGDSEPEKMKPVDMPSPRNRPRRCLTRNLSASTISSSLKRASKMGAVDRGRSWR